MYLLVLFTFINPSTQYFQFSIFFPNLITFLFMQAHPASLGHMFLYTFRLAKVIFNRGSKSTLFFQPIFAFSVLLSHASCRIIIVSRIHTVYNPCVTFMSSDILNGISCQPAWTIFPNQGKTATPKPNPNFL